MHSKANRVIVSVALVTLLTLLTAGCSQGDVGSAVEFDALLNGERIADSAPNDAIRLTGDEDASLELTLTNVSDQPVRIGYVRFEGELLDMVFLTYDTAVGVDLAPGETDQLPPILLDFFDLGGQAHGLLRGHVQLFDEDREPLGAEPMFLDARASGFSTMELFNLLLLAGTIAGAAWTLVRLGQRKLPANRFTRGIRVMGVGLAGGLTLAAAFSTLRLWPLPTLAWVLMTLVGGLIGYFIGLTLPGADDTLIDLLDEQDVLDAMLDEEVEALMTTEQGH